MRLDQAINAHQLEAKSPPGWKHTVEHMKDHPEIDNPFALAWYMKNKGDKSHIKAGVMQKTLQSPAVSGPAQAEEDDKKVKGGQMSKSLQLTKAAGKGKVKAEQPGAMVTAQPGKNGDKKGINYGTGRPGTKAEAAKKWLEHSDLANNSSGPAQQAHDRAASHYDKAHTAYSQGQHDKGDRHMFKGDRFAYLGQSITPTQPGKSNNNGKAKKPSFMSSAEANIDIDAATEHKRMARHLVTLHNGDKVEAKRHASTAARSAKRMGDSRLQTYWNSVNQHIKASIDQEVQEILGGGPGSGRHPGSGVGALEEELKPKPEAEPAKSTSLTHPADEIIGYLTAHGFAADTGHGANGDIRKGSVIYKREFSSGGDPGSGSYRSHEVHTVMVHSDGSWEHESESNHEGKGLAGVHSIHSIHAVGTNTDLDHLKRSIEAMEAREFSQDKREKMAKKGTAMKHGGFPIANKEDLSNAKQAIGRAKNRAATIAHINKRAKALGAPGFGETKAVSAGGPGSGQYVHKNYGGVKEWKDHVRSKHGNAHFAHDSGITYASKKKPGIPGGAVGAYVGVGHYNHDLNVGTVLKTAVKAESYKTDVAGPSLTGKPPSLKGEAMLTDGFKGNLSETLTAMSMVKEVLTTIVSGQNSDKGIKVVGIPYNSTSKETENENSRRTIQRKGK